MVDTEKSATAHEDVTIDGVLVKRAFLSRAGYESLCVWMIHRLIAQYALEYGKVVELLYIVLMCNNSAVFYLITLGWLVNGVDLSESFVTIYYKDCAKRGFPPGSGRFGRFGTTVNKWPGIYNARWRRSKRKSKMVLTKGIRLLHEILAKAEKEVDANVILDLIVDKKKGVPCVGNVSVLPFYSVAVRIGLLKSDVAKRNVFHARIPMEGAMFEDMAKDGCDTEAKLAKTLELAAEYLELYVRDVENGKCKTARAANTMEIYIKLQTLFDEQVGDDGRVLTLEKKWGSDTWEEYEPPQLSPPAKMPPAADDEDA